MRIALTGANGGLGQAIQRYFSDKQVELLAFNGKAELDITDLRQVRKVIAKQPLDYLIHAAAYTNVDGAERNPDAAFAVNALGTQNLALACQENGAIPVYISTDYVFDGKSERPYHEYDQSRPINAYGHSKLAGEIYLQTLLEKFYIVRTSWLFGPDNHSFAQMVYDKALKHEPLNVVANHHGSPTYTEDLAAGLWEIMRTQAFGIYHFTNSGATTWLEWAKYLCGQLGAQDIPLHPVHWADLALPALRPLNSRLDNLNYRLRQLPPVRSWQEATDAFLSQRRSRL